MATSKHVYTATLIGPPNIALSVKGGRLTLDAGRAPHVQGTLTVGMPSLTTLAALDPRLGKRVQVVVTATFGATTQSRTFNLALRGRSVSHADASVQLVLASDEAILADYGPLADDLTPIGISGSLRAVVNYVLNKAIPGSALAASPADEADVTPRWDATNLVLNPVFGVDFAGYGPGPGTSALTRLTGGVYPLAQVLRFASTTGSTFLGGPTINAGPGQVLTVTAMVASASTSRSVRWMARFRNSALAIIADDYGTIQATGVNPSYNTISHTFATPPGTSDVQLFLNFTDSASGQLHYAGAFQAIAGRVATDMISGDHPASADYVYAWTNLAHASTSTRRAVADAPDPESLIWKAGQSAIAFLAPLVQRSELRLVCDESRTWTLRSETYTAPGSVNIRHAVNMIDGSDIISRDSDDHFDAAVTQYRWTDSAGIQRFRVDGYALTSPHTRLRVFEKDTPWPGPGFSEYAVRRAQGRGREVSATTVADWAVRAEQSVQVVLSGAPIQTGVTQSVNFNLDNDEMTVSTRTIDTPSGSIQLLPGTINALAGSTNSLS